MRHLWSSCLLGPSLRHLQLLCHRNGGGAMRWCLHCRRKWPRCVHGNRYRGGGGGSGNSGSRVGGWWKGTRPWSSGQHCCPLKGAERQRHRVRHFRDQCNTGPHTHQRATGLTRASEGVGARQNTTEPAKIGQKKAVCGAFQLDFVHSACLHAWMRCGTPLVALHSRCTGLLETMKTHTRRRVTTCHSIARAGTN